MNDQDKRPSEHQIDPVRMAEVMDEAFNLDEIKVLCFDLHIDFDNLDGQVKSTKIRSLVDHLERRDRLPELRDACMKVNPNAPWVEVCVDKEKHVVDGEQPERQEEHSAEGVELDDGEEQNADGEGLYDEKDQSAYGEDLADVPAALKGALSKKARWAVVGLAVAVVLVLAVAVGADLLGREADNGTVDQETPEAVDAIVEDSTNTPPTAEPTKEEPAPTATEEIQEEPCQILSLDTIPESPQPAGKIVAVLIKASCQTELRAIRLLVDGERYDEKGGNVAPADEFNVAWATEGLLAGEYALTAQVAEVGDDNWERPGSAVIVFTLEEPDGSSGDNGDSICQVESIEVTPKLPSVGDLVAISVSADCISGVRAIRILLDGEIIGEKGGHISPANEMAISWPASDLGPGEHVVTAEVATWRDDLWLSSAQSSISFTLNPSEPPPSCPAIPDAESFFQDSFDGVAIDGAKWTVFGEPEQHDGELNLDVRNQNTASSWIAEGIDAILGERFTIGVVSAKVISATQVSSLEIESSCTGSDRLMYFKLHGEGRLVTTLPQPDGDDLLYKTGHPLQIGHEYEICLVQEPEMIRVYIDGEPVAETIPCDNFGQRLRIGLGAQAQNSASAVVNAVRLWR